MLLLAAYCFSKRNGYTASKLPCSADSRSLSRAVCLSCLCATQLQSEHPLEADFLGQRGMPVNAWLQAPQLLSAAAVAIIGCVPCLARPVWPHRRWFDGFMVHEPLC